MSGSLATSAIIMKGLHCGPACKGLITTKFSLYCDLVTIPPTIGGGGGGPYPHPAHNKIPDITNFYQEVPDQFYQVPKEKEAEFFRKYVNVVVKLDLGDIRVEKTYRVPEKRKNIVVKLFNVLNTTQQKYIATVSKLKLLHNRASVYIKNLRVRKK